MFSTDFIFRQQENLIDNQKCQAGFRPLCNKILFFSVPTCSGGGIKVGTPTPFAIFEPFLALFLGLFTNEIGDQI